MDRGNVAKFFTRVIHRSSLPLSTRGPRFLRSIQIGYRYQHEKDEALCHENGIVAPPFFGHRAMSIMGYHFDGNSDKVWRTYGGASTGKGRS